MYNIYLVRELNGGKDTSFISNNWEISYHSPDPFSRINSSFFRQPGKYKVIIVPEPPENFNINAFANAVSIPFTVYPSDVTYVSSKRVMLVGIISLGVVGVLFFFYHRLQRQRLAKQAQEKELTSIELRSVRSQLNPHFIFNALAGIQNLINQGDTEAANQYLSRFARITRNVLDNSKNDMVSVSDEIRFLEDYLQMEQLRFGFNYKITIDERIDKHSTELPSMLLQPFLENAVKHGVSNLKDQGNIETSFRKVDESLVIEVKDNGRGFESEKKATGLGWKLCEDRIQLLNRLYNGISMLLEKKSDINGTLITIRLNQWF
jgi:LytS/YehU family sensor histidine kinase